MRIYGRKILKEALDSKVKIKKVYFAELENPSGEFLKLIERVKNAGIPYKFVSKKKADNLVSGEKSQGVVIDLEEFSYLDIHDALEKFENPFVLLLDRIQDPHNFGAIVRTAVASGADFIVIPKDRSVKVTPAVVKVSAGYVFRIPIVIVTNMARTVDLLKGHGIWVYAASAGGKTYYKMDLKKPVGVVFGNEGKGIRRLVLEKCDGVISIPMKNGVESLNVAVSAGIIMYEVWRQNESKS